MIKDQKSFYSKVPLELIKKLRRTKVSGTQYSFLFYVWEFERQEDMPSLAYIAKNLNINERSVRRAIKKLSNLNALPSWFVVEIKEVNLIEIQIRDRLLATYFPLALKEVDCPAGRIDILTKSQVIEVKRIADWKSALGQILVYSAYYPEHQKRIHLFGTEADKERLLDIELSCSAFDVLVTFETIGEAE